MQEEQEALLGEILDALEQEQAERLAEFLSEQYAADIAEILAVLDIDQKTAVFRALETDDAAEVMRKADPATQYDLLLLLTDTQLTRLIASLEHDEAADLVGRLDDDRKQALLSKLPPGESRKIGNLLKYSEDSAGGIMNPFLVKLSQDITAQDAIEKIRAMQIEPDFFAVYVIDADGHFTGDVKLPDLLTAAPDALLKELVNTDCLVVYADEDQESIRNIFARHDLISLPVVDHNYHLLGRITADRVLDVANEEATEDLYRMAGTGPDELEQYSALRTARVRLSWLLPCLVGTGVTATLLSAFQQLFTDNGLTLLYSTVIAFIPMVAAISGSAGIQTSTVVISGMATGSLAYTKPLTTFIRELRVAVVIAFFCGALSIAVCSLLLNEQALGAASTPVRIFAACGSAMFFAILASTLIGLALPFLLRKLNLDPAVSSGPLVTTANDAISVTIYLGLMFLFT